MPDNRAENQGRSQRELMDATGEFCRASLQSMQQLLDVQMRGLGGTALLKEL